MSQRPSEGIGARLAKYRRLAGLSAQGLSDAIAGELSRGVIANIESGRKTDVTIDQLIMLAYALDVPPVALALPIDEPHRFITVYSSDGEKRAIPSHALTEWFQTGLTSSSVAPPSYVVSRAILETLHEYFGADNDTESAKRDDLERRLRDLGVDLDVYKNTAPAGPVIREPVEGTRNLLWDGHGQHRTVRD